MNRTLLCFAAFCGFLLLSVTSASGQTAHSSRNDPHAIRQPPSAPRTASAGEAEEGTSNGSRGSIADVEILERRIKEIENQNRLLTEMVTQLKARLDATLQPIATKTDTASPRAEAKPAGSNEPATSAAQTDKDQPVKWSELVGEGNKIKFYGFLRLDMDFDSQRPNNTQAPLFITSPDPVAGGTENGDFSMHPRLTRFGIDYSGPRLDKLGDAKLSGKLETDFENGGSESRQIIRIRQAYLRLDWTNFSFLAGQTWDIVSPLLPTVNNDTTQWNAGNVGDRRPQFRAAYEPKVGSGKLSVLGGIGLTGAIDSADLDNNGFRDGEEAARPDVQARLGYSHTVVHDQSASVGISAFYGYLKTSRVVGGRINSHAQLVNIDFTLPFTSFASLRGEGWWGRNMSDVRGGAGQGLNVATGQEIRGRGGWSEATFTVSRFLSINPGFSTDDPVDADVPGAGRTRNQAVYVANRITVSPKFLIGADYLRWRTSFKGLTRGVDNRVNVFFQYSF